MQTQKKDMAKMKYGYVAIITIGTFASFIIHKEAARQVSEAISLKHGIELKRYSKWTNPII